MPMISASDKDAEETLGLGVLVISGVTDLTYGIELWIPSAVRMGPAYQKRMVVVEPANTRRTVH